MPKKKAKATTIKSYEYLTKAEFYSAFRYRNLVFYGGPIDNLAVSSPWDIILKLDKYSSLPYPKIEVPQLFNNFGTSINCFSNAILLEIPWPDGGVPDLPKVSWTALAKDFIKISQDRPDKDLEIAVCCKGGHGRTGTALAILKALLLKGKSDPVLSIRTTYMPEAVETVRQLNYVEYVTNITVNEKSSYSKKAYSSGSYSGGSYSSSYDKGSYDKGSSTSTTGTTATTAPKISAKNPDKTPAHDYKQIASQIEKDGDLGSIAVKANEKGTYADRYPIHKAIDCIGSNCPDKDTNLQVHCGKNVGKNSGVKEVTGTILAG